MILTAKTKEEIIKQIYTDKELKYAAKNIIGNKNTNLHEDLFQDLILHFCEKDEEKIKEIYNGGYIYFYSLKYFTNNVNSNRSDFYKKYIKQSRNEEQLNDWNIFEKNEQTIKNELIELLPEIQKIINKMHWYDQRIFYLFSIENKSMREISRETTISLNSISNTINKVRKEIKTKLNDNNLLN